MQAELSPSVTFDAIGRGPMTSPQPLPDTRQLADFKRALDHAAIVATTDVTGRITYANDKFCEISGYSRDELLGQDHRIINSTYHPKEFMRGLWTTIASGRVWHGEIRNRAKDGHYYWVDTTIVPFLDERGKPYQYISIRVDVSARKAAEEKLAQQTVLTRVGEMAAVVAHEVRNTLAGVKGAMQILLSDLASDGARPVMREVVARVDAASRLIDDLMIFARPRAPQFSSVKLRAMVEDAVATVRHEAVDGRVPITVVGNNVAVVADPELLRATLLHLLWNAVQAIDGAGQIYVTISPQGEMGVVEIRDTGPGIPLEIRDRVFQPFFTTKTRGGGLGLPLARRTADLHGGSLDLDCPPEGGTRVTLRLPLRREH